MTVQNYYLLSPKFFCTTRHQLHLTLIQLFEYSERENGPGIYRVCVVAGSNSQENDQKRIRIHVDGGW